MTVKELIKKYNVLVVMVNGAEGLNIKDSKFIKEKTPALVEFIKANKAEIIEAVKARNAEARAQMKKNEEKWAAEAKAKVAYEIKQGYRNADGSMAGEWVKVGGSDGHEEFIKFDSVKEETAPVVAEMETTETATVMTDFEENFFSKLIEGIKAFSQTEHPDNYDSATGMPFGYGVKNGGLPEGWSTELINGIWYYKKGAHLVECAIQIAGQTWLQNGEYAKLKAIA